MSESCACRGSPMCGCQCHDDPDARCDREITAWWIRYYQEEERHRDVLASLNRGGPFWDDPVEEEQAAWTPTPLQLKIIEVLEAAGRPMTLKEIVAAVNA